MNNAAKKASADNRRAGNKKRAAAVVKRANNKRAANKKRAAADNRRANNKRAAKKTGGKMTDRLLIYFAFFCHTIVQKIAAVIYPRHELPPPNLKKMLAKHRRMIKGKWKY